MKINDFGEHISHVLSTFSKKRVGLIPMPLDTVLLARSCAQLALLMRPVRAQLRPGSPCQKLSLSCDPQALSWSGVLTEGRGMLVQLGKCVPAKSCPPRGQPAGPVPLLA